MKQLIFLIILSSQFCYSQTKFERNAKCTKTKNFTESQRLSNFPFSETSQIKLISFESKKLEFTGEELSNHLNSIKLKIDLFDPTIYTEVATLSSVQINKLTDIIYNYSYKKFPYSVGEAKCYEPRNAIIFLDKNNYIISFIEICFGCDRYRTSSQELNLGEECTEKFEMIKSIFKECKIEYGITRRD
ncbi:hypothetical protein WFZ85_15990 [Flavobacterium sp. j3]|uniref:Uncharacterized protein n=1 Tax=Flavobacterium aureirubrum TaxID=3133147 RepID=A0ABU9N9H3_9FLAO